MKFLEQTLRWIVIGAIFALPIVPFIVGNSLFFPYITGKNFTFRVLVEVMAGAWLALALVLSQYRPKRSWILASFALFVFIMAIADAQGAYPSKSFWSNYERMDGWVTIAHTLVFLVVATCVLNTENLWRRLLQWSLTTSIFVSILGLLQVAGILTLGSGGEGLAGRVDATFGNPIYFAAYMLFHVFIAALLWYQMWVVRGKSNRVPASVFYAVVIGLDTITLLFSGTRGATLGLILGALLALVLYAFSGSASKRIRQITVAVFAVLIVSAGGLWLARDTSFVRSITFLSRLATISLNDDTTNARLLNMGIAWQGVKERPILGWGQENYAVVFDKYYDPRMYAQEQWFDRVHNIVFDWLIAGGFLGFISYLSIFVATLWALWRKGIFTSAERSILTGLLAAYVVHNMTVFDNVTSYILFATMLGYIVYREGQAQKTGLLFEAEFLPRGTLSITAALATLGVLGVAWGVNANALAENHTLLSALQQQTAGPSQNLALFKEAIAYGTYGDQEAREQLSQVAAQISAANLPNDLKKQFIEAAVQELGLQSAASPLDARFPLFAAAVLDASGNYAEAAKQLARAHELSPRKQSILFEMAQNAELQGDTAAALQYFKTAFELDTEDLNARLYYASALIRAGRDADAEAVLAPVIATGEAADTHIAAAYAARKEYNKLIPIWKARIAVAPTDVQAYFTLAAAYYAAGDTAGAIATLGTAGTLAPSVKEQADKYIQQIKSGTLTPGQ